MLQSPLNQKPIFIFQGEISGRQEMSFPLQLEISRSRTDAFNSYSLLCDRLFWR